MRVFAGVKGGVGDVAHVSGQRREACALRFSAAGCRARAAALSPLANVSKPFHRNSHARRV